MNQAIEDGSWAVVEVNGFVLSGRVTSAQVQGVPFLRVDVPELPELRERPYGQEYVHPAIPGFSKMIGVSTISAITPCSEQVARRVAEYKRAVPLMTLEFPLRQAEATAG
jgi:hypothetical protein